MNQAKLLEQYNDLKANHERKELPIRQVYLRRIGKRLARIRVGGQQAFNETKDENSEYEGDTGSEFLYRFPILDYVQEISKIMLMNEFELLYWLDLLERYLIGMSADRHCVEDLNPTSVRLLFFFAAMYVKRFLFHYQKNDNLSDYVTGKRLNQITCIMAYVKAYHYSNFDEVYPEFDRNTNVLIDEQFLHLFRGREQQPGENFETFSYLKNLKMNDIHRKFFQMRSPLQTDSITNVIDYNWQVDVILKNSQSYEKPGRVKIELQDKPSSIQITSRDISRLSFTIKGVKVAETKN